MNVENLLNSKFGAFPDRVIGCNEDQLVSEAISLMWEHKIGAVIITNGDGLAGIFSERDVIRLVDTQGSDFLSMKLGDVMTKNVICVSSRQPVEEALMLMRDNTIRHLAVVDDEELVGFISLRDLTLYKIEYAKQVSEFMKGQIMNQSQPLPM